MLNHHLSAKLARQRSAEMLAEGDPIGEEDTMGHSTASMRGRRRSTARSSGVVVGIALALAVMAGSSAFASPAGGGTPPGPQAAGGFKVVHGLPIGPPEDVTQARKHEPPCAGPYQNVKGLGSSCRIQNGLWKVRLNDGTFVVTHGPDLAPADSGYGPPAPPPVGSPRNPVCASSAHPYYFYAIIAWPSDGTPTKTVSAFRTMIQQLDGWLYNAAVESGSPGGADYVFACDSTGQILVDQVQLPTTTAKASFTTMVSDLKAKGYNYTNQKYLVWYSATGNCGGCTGTGSMGADNTYTSDRADATNPNNSGPSYAIDFNDNWAGVDTLMHESGHNLGAVQSSAPYSTGTGYHCYQAYDIMCYNDDGSSDPGYLLYDCTDATHFDCGHHTYFDAKIGAGQGGGTGSYLDTHWNIGACYDYWIVNAACDTVPPSVTSPTQSVTRGSTIQSGQVPTTITWTGSDTGGSGLASYALWVSTNGGQWTQVTLPNPRQTSISLLLTPGSNYSFAVQAKDGAGNLSAWAYGPRFTVDTYQENAASVTYSSGWARSAWSSAWGGYEETSTTANSVASLTFTGRAISWVAPTATNRGQAYVYLDGAYFTTVDLYSASVVATKVVVSATWTASGTHTIKVMVAGTSGRPAVDVDAFVALR